MRWSAWEPWLGADEVGLAATPVAIKLQYGAIFGQLIPKALQQRGPVACFDSISRLCYEKACTIEISKRQHRGQLQVRARYKAPTMGEFIMLGGTT